MLQLSYSCMTNIKTITLKKLLYFICIIYLFYCYHTYFNPILICSRTILLLFSLIRKIDHLFYCFLLLLKPYFTSSGLFYPCFIIPNHKIACKIDYFNPILWKRCFVKSNKIHCFPFCFANGYKRGCLNLTDGGLIFNT